MNIHSSKFISAERRVFTESADFIQYKSTVLEECEVLDVVLAQQTVYILNADKGKFIILPINGALVLHTDTADYPVDSEELLIFNHDGSNNQVSITNRTDDGIRFLVFKTTIDVINTNALPELKHIDFQNKNEWGVIDNLPLFNIGIFESRTSDIYKTKSKSKVICLTISGSFEIENRLVYESDLLFLNDSSSIEFEALTEDAILLVMEI